MNAKIPHQEPSDLQRVLAKLAEAEKMEAGATVEERQRHAASMHEASNALSAGRTKEGEGLAAAATAQLYAEVSNRRELALASARKRAAPKRRVALRGAREKRWPKDKEREVQRAKVLHLSATHKWSERRIAQDLLIHRNAVRRLLSDGGPVSSSAWICKFCSKKPT